MKPTVTFAKIFLFTLSLAATTTLFAVPPKSPTPTPTTPSDEDAPDPSTIVIPGTVLERPQKKGFLSLTLEGGGFKLSFYDANKQLIAPDVARAATRWNPKQKFGEDRSVMNLAPDGQSLKGNKFVQPPFPVIVYITLLSAEGVGVESYTANFKP